MTQAYTANLNLKKVTWQGGSPDSGADFLLDFNEDMDSIDALFSAKGHTRAPTISDDSSLGHYQGEPWCDTTNHILYQAEAVGVGAALWRQVWPPIGDQLTGNVNATTLNNHADTYFAVASDLALYAKLAGIVGGQILYGGTAAGNNLELHSTIHATKGKIILGSLVHDEVNNYFGNKTTPTVALDIVGAAALTLDAAIHGMTVGQGGGAVASNTVQGTGALAANTTGASNTAVGQSALAANTTGIFNTAVGQNALAANTTGK